MRLLLTDFGKFCRKLRIENNELLKDMALKLEVTPSYLSAVERGKRNLPKEWKDKLLSLYKLSPNQLKEFSSITILTELTEKEKNALREALHVLWLADNSDYRSGLWAVIAAILGEPVAYNDGFNLRDWLDLIGME
ncbi:helix-turn-helix transcriptional regulator [Paenibacillus sp. 1182]|uniref:helix-turn-helix domain-containing protein n=1 Tax=Paenibacillus sp. 1182 TaxID=2806565 RepID=UPI0028B1A1AB|nr:helix-turn-helix transcriptional regulator [Paenibacillus sp. 1182]